MKKILCAILALAMMLSIAACGSSSAPASSAAPAASKAPAASAPAPEPAADAPAGKASFELSMANTQPEADVETQAMIKCKEILEEKTNGDIACTVYQNSELGDTDDLVEQAAQGMSVMVPTDPARLAAYIPEFGILQMPYLVPDLSYLDKVMETETYKAWDQEFLNHNVKVLAANWYGGARHFVLNKEINTPEDLAGVKVRTMKNAIATDSINAMGAVATPMSQSEVYSAVEQKALDGCENQSTSTYAQRYYEVLKVINKTNHFTLIGVPVVGTPFYDSLSPEYQKLMVDTFTGVGHDYQEIGLQEEARVEAEMEKEGVTLHEVDQTAFRERTEPLYAKFGYEELRAHLMDEMK